jgi:hypothetical protein
MLAIVEHQQELLRAERIRDAFRRYNVIGEIETERSGGWRRGDSQPARPGQYPNGGTLSPRRLTAFLSPCKTALRSEQHQRYRCFLFRFRLFRLFSFPVGSSLSF